MLTGGTGRQVSFVRLYCFLSCITCFSILVCSIIMISTIEVGLDSEWDRSRVDTPVEVRWIVETVPFDEDTE